MISWAYANNLNVEYYPKITFPSSPDEIGEEAFDKYLFYRKNTLLIRDFDDALPYDAEKASSSMIDDVRMESQAACHVFLVAHVLECPLSSFDGVFATRCSRDDPGYLEIKEASNVKAEMTGDEVLDTLARALEDPANKVFQDWICTYLYHKVEDEVHVELAKMTSKNFPDAWTDLSDTDSLFLGLFDAPEDVESGHMPSGLTWIPNVLFDYGALNLDSFSGRLKDLEILRQAWLREIPKLPELLGPLTMDDSLTVKDIVEALYWDQIAEPYAEGVPLDDILA